MHTPQHVQHPAPKLSLPLFLKPRVMLVLTLLAASAAAASAASGAPSPTPAPAVLTFAFDSVFGDNMVLQQAPAKAAVYGLMDYNASMAGAEVLVTLTPERGGAPVTVRAALNITAQTFGPDWGVRPCASCPDINPPFNPFNAPLASWKALLPPMPAGGNYSVTASCTGCSAQAPASLSLSNIAFGDMWYCSGQSNSAAETPQTSPWMPACAPTDPPTPNSPLFSQCGCPSSTPTSATTPRATSRRGGTAISA
jgi:hypothetical protein